jgi:hypothetical protein
MYNHDDGHYGPSPGGGISIGGVSKGSSSGIKSGLSSGKSGSSGSNMGCCSGKGVVGTSGAVLGFFCIFILLSTASYLMVQNQ